MALQCEMYMCFGLYTGVLNSRFQVPIPVLGLPVLHFQLSVSRFSTIFRASVTIQYLKTHIPMEQTARIVTCSCEDVAVNFHIVIAAASSVGDEN